MAGSRDCRNTRDKITNANEIDMPRTIVDVDR